MNTQHTPGPWTAGAGYDSGNGYLDWSVSDQRQGKVVYIASTRNMSGTTEKEREANARLIAAAPNMLEVCRLMADLSHVQHRIHPEEHIHETIATVEQAIADSCIIMAKLEK